MNTEYTFQKAIDSYIQNFHEHPCGKMEMECVHGCLTFHKYQDQENIVIYEIYIFSKFRQRGFCKKILEYLVDVSIAYNKTIIVEAVFSKILYHFLLRFQHRGKHFEWMKYGFLLV